MNAGETPAIPAGDSGGVELSVALLRGLAMVGERVPRAYATWLKSAALRACDESDVE